MSKMTENQFKPNYAIPPGEFLGEELESRGMSQAELAQRTGLAKKTINEIIKAKASITPESALKFERIFRLPADYWLNLEKIYQESIARSQENERLKAEVEWLKKIPVSRMIKFGWIRSFRDKTEQLHEVLSFFGVASVEQWKSIWSELEVSYRKSPSFEGYQEAVSAWLRQGELEARNIDCKPYNAKAFKDSLSDIRALTRESDPEIFVDCLQSICARCGVAVVFVPELPKTHLSGATYWIGKNRAVIQLSLRYKSNDHLWFTFFHEAGHILKHGKKDIFIDESDRIKDDKERQADEFASRTLIPIGEFNSFVRGKKVYSKDSIRRFADRLGVAPGIVVGMLQHHKCIPYQNCNDLKVRFKWEHE